MKYLKFPINMNHKIVPYSSISSKESLVDGFMRPAFWIDLMSGGISLVLLAPRPVVC